jgi:hypothetical protein
LDLTRLLVRSDLRRRWRSWLAIVVLVGVIGGVALAAIAGWRRTDTAMERFFEYHRPANGYACGVFERDEVEEIDGVEATLGGDYFLLVPLDAEGRPHPEHLGQVSPFSSDAPEAMSTVGRPIIVDGELPDPAVETEVAVDEEMAELYDLEAGDRFQMQGFGMDQVEELFDAIGTAVPTGEVFDLTATAIVRAPQDVVPHQKVPDVVYLGSAEVLLGPAFDAAHRGVDVPSLGQLFGDVCPPGSNGFELRLDLGRTSRDELTTAVRELDPGALVDFSGSDAARATEEARRSISLQATLLLALGAVVAIGGLVLITQALRRQLDADRAVQRSMGALGATRAMALRAAVVKSTIVAVGSAVLVVVVAVALSPLAPVGHARRAEIDRGVDVDVAVLVPGAIALAAFIVGLAAVRAWRTRDIAGGRHPTRAARASDRAAQAGMSPPVVAGVRAATMVAGRGTVLVTVFVASLGIVGALGFAASEQRLATEPDLWGWTFDAVLGDGNDPAVLDRAEALADDPMIDSYAARLSVDTLALESEDATVDVGGVGVQDIEGTIEPRLLRGDAPNAEDEVALGGATARKLGVDIGDELTIDAGRGPQPFTLSGTVLMSLGFDSDRIGEGALLTPEGFEALEAELEPATVLVTYADGVDPDEAYDALREDWGNTVLRPIRGVDVEQLHNVRHLPLWFSVFLAAVAAATLAFVLAVTIRQRRRDLALLRTLGFERRQLRSTVMVQSLVLVVPGTLLGILAGVVVGRLAWSATAESMGAPEVHAAPILAIVLVLAGAVLVAVLVATVPAQIASRTHPALVLRAE